MVLAPLQGAYNNRHAYNIVVVVVVHVEVIVRKHVIFAHEERIIQ